MSIFATIIPNFIAMLVKTKAIVLHSFRYGETKAVIELLTATHGRMPCIATLSKSPKAKLKKQYFQPLFIIEAVIDVRQKANLQALKEARVAVPFTSIPFSPSKLAIAMFTAEFLRCATRGETADDTLFAYVENSIRWLDGCEVYPNLDGYTPGCRFDLRASCFRTDVPAHADCLPPDESEKMKLLLRMSYPTMHLYRMSRTERGRMADVILRYYQLHVPDFPALKSLPVLKELFG